MKGIILAGGSGTRLYPLTIATSKQLLPIYDKPMIYYPLSTLMLAGIKEILIISTEAHIPQYKQILGDGTKLGISLSYCIQKSPDGLPQAFLLGESFIGDDAVALILGDNIFYGPHLSQKLHQAAKKTYGATLFGYAVTDPTRFGIIQFNTFQKVISIEEKPANPQSNFAATGLYFYDNRVIEIAKNIKPSPRKELEITDVNKKYLALDELDVKLLDGDEVWFDAGTHESLLAASQFVEKTEKRLMKKMACLEEIAFTMGYISRAQLIKLAQPLKKNPYGAYLLEVANDENHTNKA